LVTCKERTNPRPVPSRDRNPRAAYEWLEGIRDTILALSAMRDEHPISSGSQEFDPPIRRMLYGKATHWRISYAVIDGSKDGFCLTIPPPLAKVREAAASRLKSGNAEPECARGSYCRRGPGLLVSGGRLNSKVRAAASKSKTARGVATWPILLLVPQVELRKRLNLPLDAERTVDSVPGRIVANWVMGKA
jgi:hypothetical protein